MNKTLTYTLSDRFGRPRSYNPTPRDAPLRKAGREGGSCFNVSATSPRAHSRPTLSVVVAMFYYRSGSVNFAICG